MTGTSLSRRDALAACGVAVVAGLPALGSSTPAPVEGRWPMNRGGPANTGVATGPGPDGPASARWTFEEHLIARKPPVVADGRVFVGTHEDRSAFVALDAATGEETWRTELAEDVSFPDHAAALAGGVILAPFGGTLVGIEPADGTVRWRQSLGDQVRAPVVADGTAYVGLGQRGSVAAVDPATGQVYWERDVGEWSPAGVGVADGTVYAVAAVGEESGELVALDAASGEPRWTRELARTPGTAPAIADDTVYVVDDGGLRAVTTGGEARFDVEFPTPEESAVTYWHGSSAPAVAQGTVYFGAPDGHVHAVDAATGDRTWSFWTWNSVSGDPVVAGDVVYVASDDTFVYALDAADGSRLWEFDTAGQVQGAGGAVVDGTLFVSTWEDGLYALEGP